MNRKHVLLALVEETGSEGGDVAASRVKAYLKDPLGATTTEFSYVGALALRRFYVDPAKPNISERRSLWQNLTTRLNKAGAKDPGGWNGETMVLTLQAIAEEA
jgi:hypothetical protein